MNEKTQSTQPSLDDERMANSIDRWLGKSRGGYDFWKIGKLMAAADTAEFFQQHMLTAPLFKTKKAFHNAIFREKGIPGLMLEFGVAGGTSINRIADIHPHEPVYGFDSFEGLPEAWRSDYQKGHFAQRLPDVRPNVELIQGWFSETLPPFLQQHAGQDAISLLHVDCDLYSSTRTIFQHVGGLLRPGSVIVFDEYFNYPGWREHEHKAFEEFVRERDIGFSYLGAVRTNKQVAIRIDRVG